MQPRKSTSRNRLAAACCLVAVVAAGLASRPSPARAEMALVDGVGRLRGLALDGTVVPAEANVRVTLPAWKHFGSIAPWGTRDWSHSETNGAQQWRGTIVVEGDKTCRYRVTLTGSNAAPAVLTYEITAQADLELNGVYFNFSVPTEVFAGGSVELLNQSRPVAGGHLQKQLGDDPHLFWADAAALKQRTASGDRTISLTADGVHQFTIQDDRRWNTPTYSAYAAFHSGNLTNGQTVRFQCALNLHGPIDHRPASVTVDPGKELYRLDGFGGNFVFGIESPVTRFNLNTLTTSWARVGMTMVEWEPDNDNGNPADTDWKAFEARDKPDSRLRREFLLAQELARRGVPLVVSIWQLPEWMYSDPGKNAGQHRRRIATNGWAEVRESVGAYLLYAKRQYGVEPALFSFNESNEGVMVLVTAEEHRDMLRSFGDYFRQLGLKTKLLLGDVAGPANSLPFLEPAMRDPAALANVGAVAFHSWHGAAPSVYQAWSDTARRLGVPLLVTELGVDSFWQTSWDKETYWYAVKELRMYQELLQHAQPQGMMEWEFTSDYGLAKAAADPQQCRPNWRYWFVRHFANLTPHPGMALAVTSNRPEILVTAFRGTGPDAAKMTVHIANVGPSRTARLAGLPAGRRWKVLRSDREQAMAELPSVKSTGSTLELEAPTWSLTSLVQE